jgi:hypothetical protein
MAYSQNSLGGGSAAAFWSITRGSAGIVRTEGRGCYGPAPPASRTLTRRCATALRAALDPGASADPGGRPRGQADSLPRPLTATLSSSTSYDCSEKQQLEGVATIS